VAWHEPPCTKPKFAQRSPVLNKAKGFTTHLLTSSVENIKQACFVVDDNLLSVRVFDCWVVPVCRERSDRVKCRLAQGAKPNIEKVTGCVPSYSLVNEAENSNTGNDSQGRETATTWVSIMVNRMRECTSTWDPPYSLVLNKLNRKGGLAHTTTTNNNCNRQPSFPGADRRSDVS
jgi:hypothetical protein